MAASYILHYSDPNNLDSILVTSTTDGPGKNTTSTSLELVGAGYQNYGLPTAQNFLKLLENFAGPDQPIHPIKGQLWYDTSNPNKPVLRVNNGQITSAKWPSANGIYQQSSDPITRYAENIIEGDMWVDTSSNQLKIRFSNEWTIVGPNVQVGTTKTGSEVILVESTTGSSYPIIKNWVNGKVVEIISYNAFTPRTVIEGFATIKVGTNLTSKSLAKYNGLAEKASALEISSGVLIQASEVLKNNAATQTLTGSLYIQSTNGLYVRPNATSDTVRIYSDLTNAAYLNYTNTSSAATLRVGITTSSYLKFNSGYASIGINKSPTASSPALDVAGGARFLNTLTVTDTSAIALSIGGGASFGANISSYGLTVNGLTTSTGKVTVGTTGTSGIIIEPAYTDIYNIGSPTKRFQQIHAADMYAITYHGEFTGSASSLTNSRSFNVQGQVTATSVLFNGTTSTNFVTSLTRTAIADQPYTSTTEDTQTLLILNTSTTTSSLEQISKADFLSNVYPNLFVTGMITAFGTSTNLPSGFLLCDNASVSITSYPALHSVIGTTYGTGGPGTFRTPNMLVSTAIAGAGYVTYIIKT